MLSRYKTAILSFSIERSQFFTNYLHGFCLSDIEYIDSVEVAKKTVETESSVDQWIVVVDAHVRQHEFLLDSLFSKAREKSPLLLFENIDEQLMLRAAGKGVSGFSVLEREKSSLLRSLSLLRQHGSYIHPALFEVFLGMFLEGDVAERRVKNEGKLTSREQSVLQYLSKGYTQKEIANILDVTSYTIASHLKNAYRKIGVRNKGEAILYALKSGLAE